MKCRKCNREAIIFQRYSGMHLCEKHFTADFEVRAKKAIRKHGWIEKNDRIAVALSGGKDSSALLHFLHSQFSERRDLELFAITIDEGIAGYRNPLISKRIAESMGIPWHLAEFRSEFDTTLDDIVKTMGDSRSCSFCGVLRRHLLNKTARELGATKIALGFNIDDEAQSVLMNVLRGDAKALTTQTSPVAGMIPRIRPFINLPEREVALYAHLHVKGFEDAGCPYAHNALRADVRGHLNEYGYWHPATKYALVRLGEELSAMGKKREGAMKMCERCGEPSPGVCPTCRILDEVRRNE